MKKVCVITTTRAEYGLLRWTIEELFNDKDIQAQVIVSGTHMSEKFGMTVNQIEADGIPISRKISYISDERSLLGIAEESADFGKKIAQALYELNPDLVLILGDRYELLPICMAALIQNIPIAHIAGGEVTEGAIDDQVRNAVTMMASLHFPNSEEAAENIARMRASYNNVFNVGEPGIENYHRLALKTKEELSVIYKLNPSKNWILVTLHPETKISMKENLQMATEMMNTLQTMSDVEIIISESNADYGGEQMNAYYHSLAKKYQNIHVYHSFGQINYLSIMKAAWCVVGNSSSGVIETPYLGVPTLNIGNRQKGRRLASNVIQVLPNKESISKGLKSLLKNAPYLPDNSFGDGKCSLHIVKHIKKFLYEN